LPNRRLDWLANQAEADRISQEWTNSRDRLGARCEHDRAPEDLDAAFQALTRDHVQGVIVPVDGIFVFQRAATDRSARGSNETVCILPLSRPRRRGRLEIPPPLLALADEVIE
jgi:hypothetical protein